MKLLILLNLIYFSGRFNLSESFITPAPVKKSANILRSIRDSVNHFEENNESLNFMNDILTCINPQVHSLDMNTQCNTVLKSKIDSIAYNHLPNLVKTLANRRRTTISSLIQSKMTKNSYNFSNSYLATYFTVRELDHIVAPLTGALLMHPNLLYDFVLMDGDSLANINLSQLTFSPLIQNSLWFERLNFNEIPFSLMEKVTGFSTIHKNIVPVKIANVLMDSANGLLTLQKNIFQKTKDESDFNFQEKKKWELIQCLVINNFALKSSDLFSELWLEFYDFLAEESHNIDIDALHLSLLKRISIKYYNVDYPVFYYDYDEFQGHKNTVDTFGMTFRALLEWQFDEFKNNYK